MSLNNVVFGKSTEREFIVMEKKIVVRALTTRDTLEMNVDYGSLTKKENEEPDLKLMLSNMIEILSSTIVSIDGQKPENRSEMKEFLLNQEQEVVLSIFKEANAGALAQADLKN